MYPTRSFATKKPTPTPMSIENPPADSVSDIAFNPEGTFMAISAWDSSIRLYSMPPLMSSYSSTRTFRFEKTFPLQQPALSTCFFLGSIVAGLVDGSLAVLDMNGNKNMIQAHTAGVKRIKNFNNQFIISCSFDSSIKFWDLKSTNPLHTITLPSKAYSMDLKGNLLVVLLSDKSVHIYNMNDINNPAILPLRFNYSPRAVAVASDMDTIAVGGVEAKVCVFSRAVESKRSMFRAHKINQRLYAVNMVRFAPEDPNVLLSGGSDGSLVVFDRNSHMKLATLDFSSPVTAGEITPDGNTLVFAVGDDWSKGYTNTPSETKLHYLDIKSLIGSK